VFLTPPGTQGFVIYRKYFLSLAGLNTIHIRLSSIAYGVISLIKTGNFFGGKSIRLPHGGSLGL